MPTKRSYMECPITLQAKCVFMPQHPVALSMPFSSYLCPQYRWYYKTVNLLHLTPHLSNPTFTSVVSDLSTTLFWSWQFSSLPQNITYLALIRAQSPNILPGLHLSPHLPLKHILHSHQHMVLTILANTIMFSYPVPLLMLFQGLECSSLCSSYWRNYTSTSSTIYSGKPYFFFFYNLPLSVQNTSLCASIIALHFASYNSFLSLQYYNLRVRISYHLFLKFSYQYFSKCNHWSPLSESLRTLHISNAGNLHLTKPPGSFLGHIMFQNQSYSELTYCWS